MAFLEKLFTMARGRKDMFAFANGRSYFSLFLKLSLVAGQIPLGSVSSARIWLPLGLLFPELGYSAAQLPKDGSPINLT